MRQALGLRDSGPSPRPAQRREAEHRGRRFVKDGDVPVVVLGGSREPGAEPSAPTNRLAAAETAARNERGAREAAERLVADLQAANQSLKTQLAHAELSHRDALDAERQAREAAETAMREALAAREGLEAQLAELAAVPSRRHRVALAEPDADVAVRTARGRRPEAEPEKEEQEPVKWWLPRSARR